MNKLVLHLVLGAILVASCSRQKELKPEDIPSSLPQFDVLINKPGAFDGYLFLREIKSPGAQIMINNEGRIVWYQLSDTIILRVFTPYEDSYLSLHSKRELYEIGYNGDTLLELRFGNAGFDRELHHEVIKDNENNIVAITHEVIPMDLSEVGGSETDTLRTDGILRLSRTGNKLWSWNLTQVMDPLDYPGVNDMKKDWGHANSLSIDDDGHYLISWRDFNEVWKINSITGALIWKYGGDSIMNEQDRIYQQHAFKRNLAGDYMMFDNGDARVRNTSRALAFEKTDDGFVTKYTIDLPDSLFSFKQGSVYQFDEDRFLFSSTMTGSVVITNRNGDILWMAKSDHGFYRAYHLDKSVLD